LPGSCRRSRTIRLGAGSGDAEHRVAFGIGDGFDEFVGHGGGHNVEAGRVRDPGIADPLAVAFVTGVLAYEFALAGADAGRHRHEIHGLVVLAWAGYGAGVELGEDERRDVVVGEFAGWFEGSDE
jgi:hypothetical protein